MSNTIRSLIVKVGADTTEFAKKMKNIGKDLEKTGKTLSGVGNKLTMGVTMPILGAATAAVKLASDFEESSNKVATIMDQNVMSLDKMKKGALDLSDSLGISVNEINEALYSVMSANGDTANSLKYVGIAGKAAKGGFTTVETAVDGLTSVMNAYKMTGEDAMQHVSDLMLTTQNLGKTTFGDLAGSLYNVIPTAAATGVAFEEISAQMALITSQGTPTSVATTQLRQLLVELSKEGGKTSKIFKQLAGKGFKEFVEEGGTVQDSLLMLEEYAKKSNIGINDLFGSVEAGAAALQLTGENTGKYSQFLTSMSDVAGATEKAFDTMNQGTNDSIADTINMLKNLGIEIGTMLAPYVQSFIESIKGVITWFKNLDEGTKVAIMRFAGFAAIIGPVLSVVGGLTSKLSGAFKAVSVFSKAIKGGSTVIKALGLMIGPGGAILVGLAAFAAAAYLIWKNWDKITEGVKKAITKVREFFVIKSKDSSVARDLDMSSWTGGRATQYAKGTNYVPQDGLAYLHKGEAVIPAKYNNQNGSATVNHTGTIRVEGVNSKGELMGVVELLGKQISQDNRRLPNRASVIPI